MFSINTNNAAMAALQSLNMTATQLNETQNRISTGKKVNSAADNSAIYAISTKMNSDIGALSAISDNLSFGTQAIATATAGTTQIRTQLDTIKSTITQGMSSGLSDSSMQTAINTALSNIDSFAKTATFNGVNLLDGTSGNMSIVSDTKGNLTTVTNHNATSSGLGVASLNLTTATSTNFAFDNTFVPAVADTFTLTDGTNSYIFEFNDGTAALASQPNSTTKVFDVQIDTSTMSTNQMVGALVQRIQGQGFYANVESNGSLDVGGNGITATATIATGGVTTTTATGATAAMTMVNSAYTNLNTINSALGNATNQLTNTKNFSDSLRDSLTSGLGALTDADMAAESAKLQSLQTKQQLAIQSLSIANQQPQALMSLFRG